MNLQKQIIEFMKCNKCYQVVYKPVQTECCASLFCTQCAKVLQNKNKSCIICFQNFSFRRSRLSLKFMDVILVKCEQRCDQIMPIKDIRKHSQICPKRKINCNICNNLIEVNDIYPHIQKEHQKDFNFILETIHKHDQQYQPKKEKLSSKIQSKIQSKIFQTISPSVCQKLNQNKVKCYRGMNGKYYCKTKIKLKQNIFECGTGDNCQKCMKLDIQNLKLSKGYLINSKGIVSKYQLNSDKCFCGRTVNLSRIYNSTSKCKPQSPCPECGVLTTLIKNGLYMKLVQSLII